MQIRDWQQLFTILQEKGTECRSVPENSSQNVDPLLCEESKQDHEDRDNAKAHADEAKEFMDGQLSSLDTLLGYFEIDRPQQLNANIQSRATQDVSHEIIKQDVCSEEEDIRGEVLLVSC